MAEAGEGGPWRRLAARLLSRLPRHVWRSPLIFLLPMGGQLRSVHRSRLFDAGWYLTTYPDVAESGIEPLVHFTCIGGFEGRSPNRFFDSDFYVRRHGAEWAGFAAGPLFDTAGYLALHHDVAQSGMNPLLHYLRWGFQEGRLAADTPETMVRVEAPPPAAFAALAARRRPAAERPRVDVIVPVYRGHDETLACLHAVLSAPVKTPFELIVIDDCSPEPQLAAALGDLAGLGLITLLRNPDNLGFVRSVNRGMALHDDRDVVLLNADAEVYNDWLDRLAAHARDSIGTVTPFSNNATICSYPVINRDNAGALELPPQALDRMMATVNAGASVAIPTAVGFCMYITRRCLAATGPFDAETFGKGYGEENDFCCRATAQGFGHVLAGDVYVRHAGGVSFAETAAARLKTSLQALGRKHPRYFSDVQRHIKADPQRALRRAVDVARLARAAGRPAVCHVSHNWGGGVSRHVAELGETSGTGSIVLSPVPGDGSRLALNGLERLKLPNLQGFALPADMDQVAATLRQLGVGRLVIHSLAGWPAGSASQIKALAEAAQIPHDFLFHDYLAFCPRVNLVGGEAVYCGEGGVEDCRRCLAKNGSPVGKPDIEAWRADYRALIGSAARRIAPSADTAERVRRYLPGIEVEVVPHREEPPVPSPLPLAYRPGEPVRVVIVGAIGPHKGSGLLLAMAADAERRRLPLHFLVIGHTDRDQDFLSHGSVAVTGRYADSELASLMDRHRGHVALLPSVWPETYSYVLSSCLAAGYRVMAFDIGAVAERLRARGQGELLLPTGLMRRPGQVNDALLDAVQRRAAPREASVPPG
jgi:GT2 family glycosyltransferase/glycosyltransferase involved in cell wall biosynthesis